MMHKKYYLHVLSEFGMISPQLSIGTEIYGKEHTEEKYATSWSMFRDKDKILQNIKDMLEHDIPIVMLIGSSKNDALKLYQEGDNRYIKTNETSQHFVTITGLYIDRSRTNHNTMLEVSSWGEKYFIDYDEYVEFCDHFFGSISNGIVNIHT